MAELAALGEKPFRAKQLWHWIYHQGVTDFAGMSSIAGPLRERLAERFVIGRPTAAEVQTSADETRKFLFRYRDGQELYLKEAQPRTEADVIVDNTDLAHPHQVFADYC